MKSITFCSLIWFDFILFWYENRKKKSVWGGQNHQKRHFGNSNQKAPYCHVVITEDSCPTFIIWFFQYVPSVWYSTEWQTSNRSSASTQRYHAYVALANYNRIFFFFSPFNKVCIDAVYAVYAVYNYVLVLYRCTTSGRISLSK